MPFGFTWKRIFGLGVIALAAALPFGEVALSRVVVALGLISIASVVFGIIRHKPEDKLIWILFGLGIATYLVAATAHELNGDTFGAVSSAFPSLPDYLDLLPFSFAALASYRLAARRVNDDPTVLIDSLIVTTAIAVLVWTYVIVPDLRISDYGMAGKVLNVAFSLIALFVVGSVSRLAIGPGVRNPSYYLLAGFAGTFLTADLLSTAGAPPEVLLLVTGAALLSLAASVLHPGMASLSTPAADPVAKMTSRRTLVLVLAAFVPPLVLLVEGEPMTSTTGLAIAGCWLVLSSMIVVRLVGLVRVREQMGDLEKILAETNAGLAAATDRERMYLAAVRGVAQLVGPALRRASVLGLEPTGWDVLASTDPGRRKAPVTIDERLLLGLTRGEPLILGDHATVDGPGRAVPSLILLPLLASNRLRGALALSCERPLRSGELSTLQSLSTNVALALESLSLAEQIHTRRSERRFRSLIDSSTDVIVVLDDEAIATFVSPAGPRLLGRDEGEILGSPFRHFVSPSDLHVFDAVLASRAEGRVEMRLLGPGHDALWFEVSIDDLRSDAEVRGLVLTAREITQRRAAEDALAHNEARFRSLVQHASDLVCIVGPDGTFQWVSPSVERVLGYAPDEVIGRNAVDLLGDPVSRRVAEQSVGTGDRPPRAFEVPLRTSDGHPRIFEVTLTDLTDDPSVLGIVVNAHDVTDRRNLEEDLRHQALHDGLTGIPNRVLFRDRVEQALARRGDDDVAVLLIDLDDFKTVNDGLGHWAGDELLKVLSFRLKQFLRGGDTAARLGGDEFGVLIDRVHERDNMAQLTDRLLAVLQEPVEMDGRPISVSASIGVVFATDVVQNSAEALLQCADVAMYAAKEDGKSRARVFEPVMERSASERLELRSDLTSAVESGELELWYQPIVELATRNRVGFEALVRWHHPERGLVSPAVFIPLAEETGHIIEIGRWVAAEAIRQLAAWRDASGLDLSMELNLSARQLEDGGLLDHLRAVLAETGVPPNRVVVELTESMALAAFDEAAAWLHDLRELGVELYADDFGAGYASYAALLRLPFTGVKLDMSLIEEIEHDDRSGAQVGAIIDMAQRSGLAVVAEGIETEGQYEMLRRLGCGHGQGYYFGRPQPPGNQAAALAGSAQAAVLDSSGN